MLKIKRMTALGSAFAVMLTAAILFFDTRVFASTTVPKTVLADFDDRLTPSQEREIKALMDDVADKTQFHIGIVITGDLNGMSDERYTDSFGNSAFGDSDWIVLMILNSYDNPKYSGYTDVIARNDQADVRLKRYNKKMLDNMYSVMEKNAYKDYSNDDIYHLYNYYGACKSFCSSVERYGADSSASSKIVNAILDNAEIFFGGLLVGLVVATIVTVVVVTKVVSGYKNKKPISASAYIDQRRTRITRQVDQFIREYTTSHRIDSGSHHGGGGGHSHSHSHSHGHHR